MWNICMYVVEKEHKPYTPSIASCMEGSGNWQMEYYGIPWGKWKVDKYRYREPRVITKDPSLLQVCCYLPDVQLIV